MKEKSLPRRGFKERKKEIERFFYIYYYLAWCLCLFVSFSCPPSISLSAIPKLGTQNKLLGTDRKKEKEKHKPRFRWNMSRPTTTTHPSLIRTCVSFVLVLFFGLA